MKTIEVLVRRVGGILDGNHYTYHPTIPDGRRISRQELAGVVNPIPLNNLIGRFSRGANEAIRTALAAKGL